MAKDSLGDKEISELMAIKNACEVKCGFFYKLRMIGILIS